MFSSNLFTPYLIIDNELVINELEIPSAYKTAYVELISGKTARSIIKKNIESQRDGINTIGEQSIIDFIEKQGLKGCFSYFGKDGQELIRNNETGDFLCTCTDSTKLSKFEKMLFQVIGSKYDKINSGEDAFIFKDFSETERTQVEFFEIPISANSDTLKLLDMACYGDHYRFNLTELKQLFKPENERVLVLVSELIKNNQIHVKDLPDFSRSWNDKDDYLYNHNEFRTFKKFLYSNPNSVESFINTIAYANKEIQQDNRTLLSTMYKHYHQAVDAVERFENRYGPIADFGHEFPAQLIAFTIFIDKQFAGPSYQTLLNKVDSCIQMAMNSSLSSKYNIEFTKGEYHKLFKNLSNKLEGVVESNCSPSSVKNKHTVGIE